MMRIVSISTSGFKSDANDINGEICSLQKIDLMRLTFVKRFTARLGGRVKLIKLSGVKVRFKM